MPYAVGVNGFGRIGRLVTRATLQRDDLQVVAINDPLMDAEDMAYLLKYDTTQGTLTNLVHADGDDLVVDGRRIHCTSHANPEDIPWMERGVDVVCEASGKFLDVASCNKHIDDAIPVKVILCAPGKTDDIPMFVYGVNHQTYQPHTSIISNASCTTNCLAPVCKVLQEEFGIQHGLMTTVHATTATQRTVDGPSKKDRRRGRAAAHNIFPTSSGAAKAVAKVVPGLDGKLTGLAVRIPPTNGSLVDLSVVLETPTTYQSVMHALKEAAEGPLKGVLGWTDEELVSTDIVRNPNSGVVDARAGLQVAPTFMKIIVWYDNEWGYSNRWCDLAAYVMAVDEEKPAPAAAL